MCQQRSSFWVCILIIGLFGRHKFPSSSTNIQRNTAQQYPSSIIYSPDRQNISLLSMKEILKAVTICNAHKTKCQARKSMDDNTLQKSKIRVFASVRHCSLQHTKNVKPPIPYDFSRHNKMQRLRSFILSSDITIWQSSDVFLGEQNLLQIYTKHLMLV